MIPAAAIVGAGLAGRAPTLCVLLAAAEGLDYLSVIGLWRSLRDSNLGLHATPASPLRIGVREAAEEVRFMARREAGVASRRPVGGVGWHPDERRRGLAMLRRGADEILCAARSIAAGGAA